MIRAGGRPSTQNLRDASEGQPASELERTGATGAGDAAEVHVVDAQLRVVVVFPIQDVEHVCTDLQPSSSSDPEILRDRRVNVQRRRAAGHVQHVRAWTKRRVGDGAHRHTGEAGRVEIAAAPSIAPVSPVRKDEIHPGTTSGRLRSIPDGCWTRSAWPERACTDAGELPAPEHAVQHAVSAVEAGKLVNERRVQTMPNVVA